MVINFSQNYETFENSHYNPDMLILFSTGLEIISYLQKPVQPVPP